MKNLNAIQKNFKQKVSLFDLAILALLFFIWGFLTQLNDLLIPNLYLFGLSLSESLILHFAFYTTYLIASFPAAKIIERFGYKNGILTGLGLAALGCLLFFFGADKKNYTFFLSALFVIASGVTMLQIAANGYVVLQSNPRRSASNLTFAQAFNSFGRIFIIISSSSLLLLLTNISIDDLNNLSPKDYVSTEVDIIKTPYLLMAGLIVITGVLFYTSKLPDFKTIDFPVLIKSEKVILDNVLKVKHLMLGAVAIFLYVGAEVSIGTYLTKYISISQTNQNIISDLNSSRMLQYYWGSAMIGRIIGGFVMRDLSPRKVAAAFAGAAALFTLVSIFSTGNISIVTIIAVGFFNSILFPTIFTLAINGLGHFAEEGAAILISSIVGGAIIPLIVITSTDFISLKMAFLIPVACYVYVMFFSMYGSEFVKVEND